MNRFLYDPIVGLNHLPPPDGIRFSQGFGQHAMDYSPFIGHNGHDYAAPLGTPVYAMCDGWIVESTAKETGYGLILTQWIEIDGREFDLTYGHFQKVEFPDIPWQYKLKTHPVKAGQLIGHVNSTGRSTGNHLHITLREWKNGSVINQNNGYGGAVDPSPYLLNKDAPMSNVIFVHKSGTAEYGFYVPATLVETLKDKALNFGLDITKSDGSVDFAKAKEVKFDG